MSWVQSLKDALPDYAKDTKLNLDGVVNRSTLDADEAHGCALAAAVATGNGKIVSIILGGMENAVERDAAMTAASIMAQNNVWYPYVEMVGGDLEGIPPQLRIDRKSVV